jgi:CRISPR-associated protein (TIGR02584 family)
MKTEARSSKNRAKRHAPKTASAATGTITTFSGRLAWVDGEPVLRWQRKGEAHTVSPYPNQLSPSLLSHTTGDAAVSFDLAEDRPVHIRRAGDKWRVLACVLGGTPAVITETLQELLERRFVPDHIAIFTTTTGERGLDTAFEANLGALCAEYGAAVPHWRPVELLRDAVGAPLSDIRSDADNVGAANVIANAVRDLTRFPETVVHASVAGGRKTMGTLLSDAMSLFGRAADTVSHVLVQPEAAEFARNFYYRPRLPIALLDRDGKPVKDRAGRALTSGDVQLDLATKPFFRLRGLIDEPLLADTRAPIDFAAVTAAVNVTANRPMLIVHPPATGEIEIADFRRIALDPTHYALFRVTAEAMTGGLPGTTIAGTLTPGDFQSLADTDEPPADEALVFARLRPAAQRYLSVLRQRLYPGESWTAFRASEFWRSNPNSVGTGFAIWRIGEYEKAIGYLNPILTRLNESLAEGLGSSAVARLYGIERHGRGPMRFRLACGADLIDLLD